MLVLVVSVSMLHFCVRIKTNGAISSDVLIMIGVLPLHPSPMFHLHVVFVLWWLVDRIGGLVVWLICGSMRWVG